MADGAKRRVGTAAVIVIACGAFLAGCGNSWDEASRKVDAQVACEEAVAVRLKHPDVVEFDHRSYRPADSSGVAEVRGVVKTVNPFNAPVRVTYGCKVSGGRATVSELFEP